jgi:NADP-dependent 3-hydroxy acid dehydrogenase YdfG
MDMKDKVVVVTGAGTGLGKSISIKLAALGAKVALISRTQSELELVKSEVAAQGGFAEFYVCDISDEQHVSGTIQKIKSTFKSIDILINNAGIWTDEELEKANPSRRKKALETNVLGNIQMTYAVLPIMQKQKSGHIFNVISTSGANDTPAGNNTLWKTYGATKWAMTGFTQALRESLTGTKIKVTAFHPGGFDSMLYEKANRANPHNQPWMMQTNDVADVAVFALTRPHDVQVEKIIVTKI